MVGMLKLSGEEGTSRNDVVTVTEPVPHDPLDLTVTLNGAEGVSARIVSMSTTDPGEKGEDLRDEIPDGDGGSIAVGVDRR